MGYPRNILVPPDAPSIVHCVSRCVRHAFLCGVDAMTGRSFEHRRAWLEERILALPQSFAVAVHAYAVMHNHFHIVVQTNPKAPWDWDDETVARRWLALPMAPREDPQSLEQGVRELCENRERLHVLRERLGSLSWFMRFVKEPIARRANREDQCRGRFWEGRFKTQVLLDETAILACMVYVDLNPVRANIASTPERSEHTSIAKRLNDNRSLDQRLQPMGSSIGTESLNISEREYAELVDWTGRIWHPNKPGAIDVAAPPLLERLAIRERQWRLQVPATESHYKRAIGTVESLTHRATEAGLRWLAGIGLARRLRDLPDTG